MNQEKLIAIETLIRRFAETQFASNNVHPVHAMLIMKSICLKFMDVYVSDSLYSRINFDKDEAPKTKTGTVDELIESFNKTGLKPD